MREAMNIQLTFNSTARREAMVMRSIRGIETPETFEGPLFVDVVSMTFSEWYVHIHLRDGTVYMYRSANVSRIKQFYTEVDE